MKNRERCEGVNALGAKEKTYSLEDRRNNWELEPSSAAGLVVENQPSNATHCMFCKQQHPPASCHIATNKRTRKECLKKQCQCFICLRKSHLVRDSRSKITCSKCSGRHHVSLCEIKPPTLETRQTNVNSGNATNHKHPPAQASTLHMGSPRSILLQTAQSEIRMWMPELGWEREWFLIQGARRATSRNTHVTRYSCHPLAKSRFW